MANYNKVLLMGNLTRDPQLRYTPSQQPVCDIGMAINRKWKAADGTMKEEVCFVNCTAWGRTAENIAKFFSKGRPIFVEGRLTYQTWDGPDGKKNHKLFVTIDRFEFIDSARGGQGGQGGQGGARPAAAPTQDAKRQETSGAEEQKPPDYDFSQDVEDDTIPF